MRTRSEQAPKQPQTSRIPTIKTRKTRRKNKNCSLILLLFRLLLFALFLFQDEEEVEAEANLSPSDPAVVARAALMVHPSSSASSSSSALVAPNAVGSVDFAADGSSIDLSEEERAELKKLNKKLNRMQKNAAAAAATSTSGSSAAAGRAVSGAHGQRARGGGVSSDDCAPCYRAEPHHSCVRA